MKVLRLIAFAFFLFTSMVALCRSSRATEYFEKSRFKNENDSIIDIVISQPHSAARLIRELIASADNEGQKYGRTAGVNNKIGLALFLESYALDSFEERALVHSRFADLCIDGGDKELALKQSKLAYAYYKIAVPKPTDKSYNMTGKIGSFYLQDSKYDSALYYYKLAEIEAAGTSNQVWVSAAANNLGILYYRQHRFNEAMDYFNRARNSLTLRSNIDTILYGSICDNIATIYQDDKHYDSALVFYQSNTSLYAAAGVYQNVVKTQGKVARLYAVLNRIPEMAATIQFLEVYMHSHGLQKDGNDEILLYELHREYFEHTGQWKEAASQLAGIIRLKDSLNQQASLLLKQGMTALTEGEIRVFEREAEVRKRELEQKEMDLQLAKRQAIMNRILIFMAVIIILLLFAYYFSRVKMQSEQLRLHQAEKELVEKDLSYQQLVREKLEQELKYKKGDLSNLSVYLASMKDLYDHLLERLNSIGSKMNGEQKEQITRMVRELESRIQSGEKVSLIQENVEMVNKEYYDKLIDQFPELTKSEVELCGLLKLNMSNKEIAALKNISAESVKMARYRLRKKLGLTPEEDIYRFLASL